MTERRARDKKSTKSPSLLHMSKKSSNFAAFLERNPKTRRRTLTQLRTNEIWKISSKGGSNCFLRIYAEYLSVYVAWSIILFIFRKVIPEPVSR